MSIQPEDRTTIDMFSRPERGRPKTSPYDRSVQLRMSKRSQRARDKQKGLRRVEVKLDQEVIAVMDGLCETQDLSRAELIEQALLALLEQQDA
jgi:hypothetical protein